MIEVVIVVIIIITWFALADVDLNDDGEISEEGVQKYEKFIRVAVHNKNNNNNKYKARRIVIIVVVAVAATVVFVNRTATSTWSPRPRVQKKRIARNSCRTIAVVSITPAPPIE